MTSIKRFMAAGLTAGVIALTGTAVHAGTESMKMVTPPAPAPEPEPWLTGAVKVRYDSKYIFRGVDLGGDNLVSTDLSFSAYGFTLGAWYADAATSSTDLDELDLYASYTYDFDFGLSVTGGYIYYYFPYVGDDGDDATQEFFGSLAYGGIPYVTPSLSYYHDFDLFDGGWAQFRLDGSIPLVEDKLSLDPWVAISYDFSYNSDTDDWNSFDAGAALTYQLLENVSLSAYVAVTEPLSAIDDFADSEWYGGGYVTVSF